MLNINLKKTIGTCWRQMHRRQQQIEMVVTPDIATGGLVLGSASDLVDANLKDQFPDVDVFKSREEAESVVEKNANTHEHKCTICQESVMVTSNCCGMRFHPDCLVTHLTKSSKLCPGCRHLLI